MPAKQFTASDYFWKSGQSALETAGNWSTNQLTLSAATSLGDTSTKVFDRMSVTGTMMTSFGEGLTLKGIRNSADPTKLANAWTWYNSSEVNDTVLTLTDGILNEMNVSGYTVSALTIRGRMDSKNLSVTSGTIYGANGSTTVLGDTSAGTYLKNLTVTGDIALVGNSSTNRSTLSIATTEFSMTSGKGIYLDNGVLKFNKGASGGKFLKVWTDPTLDLTNNKIYATGKSDVTLGYSETSPISTAIKVGDIEVKAAQLSDFSLYAYTSSTINIGNIVAATSSATTSGGAFRIYANGSDVTVASMDVAVATLTMQGNVTVSGNFTNKYQTGNATDVAVADLGTKGSRTLTIGGVLQNDGRIRFDGGTNTAVQTITVKTLGITSTISGGRLTTNYGAADRAQTVFELSGSGVYEFKSRTHDIGQDATRTEIASATYGTSAAISILKKGSGTQKFTGIVYIRGDVVVEDGTLLMNASGTGKKGNGVAEQQWGLGDVYLKGGYFGAIGEDGGIGSVMANSITFDGGALVFNFNGASFDTMSILAYLSGSTAITVTDGSKAKFEFNFVNFDDGITSYEIMDFNGNSVDASIFENALYTISGVDTDLYEAELGLNSNGNLALNLTLVPEPSAYAALFGLIALAFALRRKKSK